VLDFTFPTSAEYIHTMLGQIAWVLAMGRGSPAREKTPASRTQDESRRLEEDAGQY
jgi:hypothetical protein